MRLGYQVEIRSEDMRFRQITREETVYGKIQTRVRGVRPVEYIGAARSQQVATDLMETRPISWLKRDAARWYAHAVKGRVWGNSKAKSSGWE